ncbi:MAG: ferritin family protein [Kofleriaceae bacterium]
MTAAAAAASVWRQRALVEHEAARRFAALARGLAALGWHDLAARATAAADDERDHVGRCGAILDALGAAAPLPAPTGPPVPLGPATLAAGPRVLYAAVAIGCVTESLACALLAALAERAEHPVVARTVAAIQRDEVEHARLGWAVLARCAGEQDVAWLGAHVDAMRAAAVADDVAAGPGRADLAGFGVLAPAEVGAVVSATWGAVIAPGLARYGVSPPPPAGPGPRR